MVFLSQNVDGKMIFTDYRKRLVLIFSEMENTPFSWAKKLMDAWYLLITEKVLFWTFRWWELRSFFQTKCWWEDDIYMVFLSILWYSRAWEIWFFMHCIAQLKWNRRTYFEYSKEITYQGPKFKIGDIVRISKYKNTFAKGYALNWSKEVFVIKKVKTTVPWAYVISDLKGEEIVGMFYEKELQKTNQKEFRAGKRMKIKC